jgi:peroxisomal coenzyme A diphosphatase NUDT7
MSQIMVLFPEIQPLSPAAAVSLSGRSKQCIDRLAHHKPAQSVDLSVSQRESIQIPRLIGPQIYPTTKLAAVLVLLYERGGKLRVLLTTRSKFLRSHPGQTALPGGKADYTDRYITTTAVSTRSIFEYYFLLYLSPGSVV